MMILSCIHGSWLPESVFLSPSLYSSNTYLPDHLNNICLHVSLTRLKLTAPWGQKLGQIHFRYLSVSKTLLDTEQALNKWFLNVKKKEIVETTNNKILKMSDFVASHTHTPPDPSKMGNKTCCRKAEGLMTFQPSRGCPQNKSSSF